MYFVLVYFKKSPDLCIH